LKFPRLIKVIALMSILLIGVMGISACETAEQTKAREAAEIQAGKDVTATWLTAVVENGVLASDNPSLKHVTTKSRLGYKRDTEGKTSVLKYLSFGVEVPEDALVSFTVDNMERRKSKGRSTVTLTFKDGTEVTTGVGLLLVGRRDERKWQVDAIGEVDLFTPGDITRD